MKILDKQHIIDQCNKVYDQFEDKEITADEVVKFLENLLEQTTCRQEMLIIDTWISMYNT